MYKCDINITLGVQLNVAYLFYCFDIIMLFTYMPLVELFHICLVITT
jgi:hypothetical protein